MVALIFAGLAIRIEKIGNRRAAHANGLLQDFLKRAMQHRDFLFIQRSAESRGMNFRAPQTLIGVDIADAAQEALIQQQRFDPGPAVACLPHEIFDANFQGIGTKGAEFFRESFGGEVSEPPKPAWIGVTQFAIVIEQEKCVGVLLTWLSSGSGRDLSGHSEVNKERGGGGIAIRGRRLEAPDG